jgi:hypothetical protein
MKSADPEISPTLSPAALASRETLIESASRSSTFHRLERLPLNLIGTCHDCQTCDGNIIGVCMDCNDAFLCKSCFKAH